MGSVSKHPIPYLLKIEARLFAGIFDWNKAHGVIRYITGRSKSGGLFARVPRVIIARLLGSPSALS